MYEIFIVLKRWKLINARPIWYISKFDLPLLLIIVFLISVNIDLYAREKAKPADNKLIATPLGSIQKEISGRVTDQSNQPLAGVTVSVQGDTTNGTSTDENGSFRLTVSDEAVIMFSFTGYRPHEEGLKGRETINVSLVPQQEALDEVVVVGYGTVRRRDLTGSVAQVKAQEVNAFPAANLLQSLSGRAAGVQVAQSTGAPGPPLNVRIRGGNSIQGSNEPLYVIDGFPTAGINPSLLNNADIESMEILKDASATAIYGSRGANGVVMITTKQGAQGDTKVDFELNHGIQTLRRKLDLMNSQEYATFYNLQATNDNLDPYFSQEQINLLGTGFDWQDFMFQRAPMTNASLNISGGSERTQFSVAGSVFDQNGIVKGSDYSRYSFRTNVNHKISEKFRVTGGTILTRLTTNRRDSRGGNRGNSMMSAALSAPPTLTPFNDDGTYRNLSTAYPFIASDLINPINWINEQTNATKANVVLANAALLYNPIPEITVKILGGIENRDERIDNYTTNNFQNSQGQATVVANQSTSLLSENTISYDKTFSDIHNLSALVGFTYQNFLNTTVNASGTGFISNAQETHDLGSANVPGIPVSGYDKSALISYLARVNYTIDDRFLFTASFRADGSSRYSDGNKWGYFPSAAAAWRLSNEAFLQDHSVISDLKLRTSWGLTGSQAIDPYSTLNRLLSGNTVFGEDLYVAYAPGTMLPGNLKWETTEQVDVGLDLGLWNNRLLFTADYYVKNTRDLLNTVGLPSSMGFITTIQNVGQIKNSGIEFGLEANILPGPFKWDVLANIAFNRNKIVRLYNGEDILGDFLAINIVNDNTTILREGQPRGMFYGFVEEGYTEDGQIRYRDLDGDGSITANDKTYIGNPNPDFIYGFNSVMSYKNFELSFFIQGSYGNDVFNASAIANTIDYNGGLNMPREVLYDHWTPQNTQAKYPNITRSTTSNISDRFVEDGSFLRLRNIQLAYNLPMQDLGIAWCKNAQVYVSGQNLLTLTNYSWWDPEVGFNGTDFLSYPMSKTIMFGIKAGF
ncbi:TonB-dependent receptor [Olivibacter sp. SDN3]|uniref:SusC/RagA family TonB-linked outer membrane protein n=1 Tax=Olivibacter sp. SDN3 TaxID=2764720 RepID=UPI0016516217|nr:TonB-dependent receptor [Olivibacter sp. SDN3]QNL52094.1 TonB-dependent receptor [Olivibacter sp. SDN3]